MNKNKGFTLIELLVVIAIIGILASVVLASLNQARKKGADAAVKANMSNMRAQAELFYDSATPNSYNGLCADSNISKMETSAVSAGNNGGLCSTSAAFDSWSAWAGLKSDTANAWCVDSTGQSKQIVKSAAPTLGVACP